MNREIIGKRIRRIRRELNTKKIDCLIVTKPANVTYTTGFMGDDSWAIITKRAVYLMTDSRYTEQAEQECIGCRIVARTNSMAEAVVRLRKKLKTVRSIGIEKSTSLAAFESLKKHVKLRLKAVSDIIETVRRTKDSSEIVAIKASISISAKALKQTVGYIKPGVTESELAGMLDFQIRKLGATNSFDTIVAFGPNASRPHHQPSKRKLKKRDTVLIDFGARYKGYCSDITRSFAAGRPTRFFEKVYEAVQQAQAAAIKTIKAGVEMVKVDAAARQAINSCDLPVYEHGTGHGFGLEIHEFPFLKAQSKGKLKAGDVITIEPGVYIPGKLGVRIEDDVLVTDTGCKILTNSCQHMLKLSN
ncbi:MAG: M24 family metallopeptidase [Phycisphaerae bacterium]|nr:aminopeptidase P family protein [Phycisphaerae bacterium]NIP55571.1 aminopeptidase P family protein [Phycisphaerae bacterium]NIS54249.1 aminopeptidase P family protein [Phycisphaerae bacterium]NIU11901.1 aminopeptidase P family protein [Phycisphaerae bacterium]NIU60352.1 M24 family metallopeptidase [Phycisphaerae bacterium]